MTKDSNAGERNAPKMDNKMENEIRAAEPKILSVEEQEMADGHRYQSEEFRAALEAAKPGADRKRGPKDGPKDGPRDGKDAKPGMKGDKKAFKDGDKGDKKGAKAPAKASERIAKVLARAGLASRREVERLIGLGKIAVNGRILETPAVLVASSDVITVEGQVIGKAEPTRLWRYHKPVGLMTTHSDPQGRPTVFEKLPQPLPRVISVGRLDINSEGLLLLTNDGELARALEMPSTAWVRRYRVRALGNTSQNELNTLKSGTTVDGVIYGPMEATLDKLQEKADGRANIWLTVAITEGKNREVRKVLESIGLKVNRLIRLAYGPFLLGNLEAGDVEEVGPRVIRELLGDKIDPRNLPPEGASQTRDAPKAYGSDSAAPEGRRAGGDRFGKTRSDGGRDDKPGFAARPERSRSQRDFQEKREYKERDFDQRPRFEGDGEARNRSAEAPRAFTPRPDRPRPDRPSYGAARTEGDKKPWTPRPERSGERPQGSDRPAFKKPYASRDGADRKPYGDKPRFDGARSDRPAFKKPYASRDGAPPAGEAGAYERAKREFGGGDRSQGDRPQSDRPRRDFGDRPQGARPQGDRPAFKKPYASRDGAERKSFGDKPRFDGPRSDRPQGARPQGDRPAFKKPYAARDGAERKSFGDKPRFDRPQGERPQGDRPSFRPREDRGADAGPRKSYGDKPRFDRSASGEGGGYKGKPSGPRSDRPAGGFKSSGPRSDGPRSGGPRPGGKPGGFKPGGARPAGKPGGFDRKPRRD